VLVLLFLFAVIKKKTEFLLATVLFTYGSSTIQNKLFGGISIGFLFPEWKRRSE
jgi:hypothetical protein